MTAMSSSERLAAKTQEIRRVLSEPTVDLWRLRELALSDGGLVNGMSMQCVRFQVLDSMPANRRHSYHVFNWRGDMTGDSRYGHHGRHKQTAYPILFLLTDSLRKLAWPKLVGVDVDGILDCRGKALDLPSPEDG